MSQPIAGEIVDYEQFFAPANTDLVDGLIGLYNTDRARIGSVAGIMAGELGSVIKYFMDGNKGSGDRWYGGIEELFQSKGAIAALNSDYWNRALRLTDVLDCMPQKRRDEWFEQISAQTAPDFEEETVRTTILDLISMRGKFFAERVDGIFRELSGTHVTNEPQGFGKRMILACVIQSFGTVNHSKSGYINDLRAVVAKFMGRDDPRYGATDAAIQAARRNPGQWMSLDGGALRIRVYNGVGTAHLEVHPEMAWRLNCVLASLYPTAIPPKFRQKPAKKQKDFVMMGRPLPFAVVSEIAAMKEAVDLVPAARGHGYDHKRIRNTRALERELDKASAAEIGSVLEAIGAVIVRRDRQSNYFQFDYDPQLVIDEIVCSGCIPDQKSHQFYPTPASLAEIAVGLAEIGPDHQCLEPSAGIGGLADLMPKDRTHCVEISDLHCKVLEAKGYSVCQSDFLEYAPVLKPGFDRVIMNPPFSEGRWQAHLMAAAGVVMSGGRLVAILPASSKGKTLLPNWDCKWSQVYDNEFAGTSVSVVILAANRCPF